MVWVCEAGVGPAILTAYKHIKSIPSDSNLSIDQAGQRPIHFRLPNASKRRELFAHHLPNPKRVTADYEVLAALSRGLSGGEIRKICVSAIHQGSAHLDPAKWMVSQPMLKREIAKVKKTMTLYSRATERPRRRRWPD